MIVRFVSYVKHARGRGKGAGLANQSMIVSSFVRLAA